MRLIGLLDHACSWVHLRSDHRSEQLAWRWGPCSIIVPGRFSFKMSFDILPPRCPRRSSPSRGPSGSLPSAILLSSELMSTSWLYPGHRYDSLQPHLIQASAVRTSSSLSAPLSDQAQTFHAPGHLIQAFHGEDTPATIFTMTPLPLSPS